MSILFDIIPLAVSLLMGVLTTHWKQKAQDLHDERMHNMKSTQAAREYQTPTTSKSRKFIVQSVIGSLFLFPMLVTLLNFMGAILVDNFTPIIMNVPKEIAHGGLFSLLWNSETVEYIQLQGFVLMPIHLMIALSLTGFYFGASAMRR